MSTSIYNLQDWAARQGQDPVLRGERPSAAQIIEAVEILTRACHGGAVDGGWWTDLKTGQSLIGTRNIPELMMLMVSEIGEAMEAYRKGLADDKLPHRSGVETEIADLLIRAFDFWGALRLDPAAVAEKILFNSIRSDHKPENRRLEGGKSF